jgi:hypothetical protein
MDGSGQVKFSSRWSVTVDASYARTGNIPGTGHSASVMDVLARPVFYPLVFTNSDIFVEGLGGASRVNSAVPVSASSYLAGWVTRPSFAVGGGVERALFGPVAVRVQGDYHISARRMVTLPMRFGGKTTAIDDIVYRFGHPE